MPWTQLLIILIPTSCNYTLLRFYGTLGPSAMFMLGSLSVSCCMIVICAFPMGAFINSRSIAYLNSFKRIRKVNSKTWVTSREVKCCRPLKVQIGSMLFMRKFTVLKVISLIIYWTMRSMLIF